MFEGICRLIVSERVDRGDEEENESIKKHKEEDLTSYLTAS